MKINIYFHKDFDGIVSAALITKIFSKFNKYDEYRYFPVDYNMKDKWLDMNIEQPFAILDFLYHPKSEYYFDHHTTSFLNDNLKRNFKETDTHIWNDKFKSTPSLLKYKYKNNFDFSYYSDLIKWSDIIDSAGYISPKDLYDYSNEYINLNKLIGYYYSDDNKIIEVVNVLINNNLQAFLKSEAEVLRMIKKNENYIINSIYSKMVLKGNVCFFDQSKVSGNFQRYVSYYFYPDIDYTIAIYKKENNYSVSIGYNPWKNNNDINLGEVAKHFGGGGRMNVAGILANSYSQAQEISDSIINYLKANTRK